MVYEPIYHHGLANQNSRIIAITNDSVSNNRGYIMLWVESVFRRISFDSCKYKIIYIRLGNLIKGNLESNAS